MVTVTEYQPASELAPYVNCYSEGVYNTANLPGTRLQVIPNGCLELIIHLNDHHCTLPDDGKWTKSPDYMIIGLLTSHYEVRFPASVPVFNIRFRPEALYSLFSIPGKEVVQAYGNSTDLLGKDFRDFCHRIKEDKSVQARINRTEAYLKRILIHRKPSADYVVKAAHLMRSEDIRQIGTISDRVHISQRQLERQFKQRIGISPKKYLRLVRINRVMQLLQNGCPLDLTSVAYHCGYFDQAHFIKDFKALTGQKPKVFLAGNKEYIVQPGLSHT